MTDIVSVPAAVAVPDFPALGDADFNGKAYTWGSAMPSVSANLHAIAQTAYTNAIATKSAKNDAENARDQAQTARDEAQTARTDAQTARGQAQNYATNASNSATAAQNSANAAAASAESIDSEFLRNRANHMGTQSAATLTGVVGSIAAGAIIERGENTNGEYVKFVDGTLICSTHVDGIGITHDDERVYRSNAQGWTFPHNFVDAPCVSVNCLRSDPGIAGWACAYSVDAYATVFYLFAPQVAPESRSASLMAIGRWR